jgi:putative FmdB family regulatory protein
VPIYEFYCRDCHTVFSFFSAQVDTTARPLCPRCGRRELERRPSRFAALTGARAKDEAGGEEEDAPLPGLDERRLEGAMESLGREMEGLSDAEAEDPRALARFFRRFGDAAGLEPGPRMEEMLRRLESGEDPDALDDEMGGDEEGEGEESLSEFFRLKEQARAARRSAPPAIDDTLYFL